MPPLPPLFAFDLASPTMLGWLAAAAAPILIHLWSRRRYREMPWAAMEYLLAAFKASRRRMRFEQWLLLAVRTLLVLLVVLAVAEPLLERPGLGFVAGEPAHRVLVLDGSYSMAYRPTDQARFDRAKELAARIVEESPQGDAFTLVLMSDPPRTVIGNPVFEPGDFLPELNGLQLPHGTADLAATLAEVEQLLARARREQPRLAREEIYFLTDLGRVGWASDLMDPAARVQARQRLQRLAESASLVILDVGQSGADNTAVTGVRTSEPFATPAREIEITADLRNFGRQSRNRVPVELLVDGSRVKETHVDLAAGGQAAASFAYRFSAPGDHAVEIRAQGDLLDVDNHRWTVVPVKERLNVLCVDGQPASGPLGGATGFLRYALAPQGDDAPLQTVRPDIVPEIALVETDLVAYDAVFLCNVAQFTTAEARLLEAYLKTGGSVVFFLGDRVLADRYNQQLAGAGQGGVRILPARLGPAENKTHQRLDPLGYQHPLVQAFRGREKAGLLTSPVHGYFKLVVPTDSATKVALALDDGTPLVVEAPVYEGRVVLVATSADASWTDLPRWPSYLPLVQEILAFATSGRMQQKNLLVGQAIGQTLQAAAGNLAVSVRTPSGSTETVRPETQGDTSAWSYASTSTSGVYDAETGEPPRRELFAVNVDTVESDLAQVSAQQLRNEFGPGIPFVHQTTWTQSEGQPAARRHPTSGLAKGLLYGVLGLLFVETFLARRFGYHAT